MTSPLLRAATELRNVAANLRDAHTINGLWDGTEPEAKAEHDRLVVLAMELEQAHGRLITAVQDLRDSAAPFDRSCTLVRQVAGAETLHENWEGTP